MMSEHKVGVDFELGEDVRNEVRKQQDEKWSSAVQDGRSHLSHRETSTKYRHQFINSIADYNLIEYFVNAVGDTSNKLSVLNCIHPIFISYSYVIPFADECIRAIVEFAFGGHGPLVTSIVENYNYNYKHFHSKLDDNSLFQIFIRKRPMLNYDIETGAYDVLGLSKNTPFTCILHDGRLARNGRQLMMSHRHYTLSHCFDETASNHEVCERVVEPLIEHIMQGKNSTLLCYGQTGTGKTHSLVGAIRYISGRLEGRHLTITFYEIHEKKSFDLMNNRKQIHLRSDERGEVHPRGVKATHLPSASAQAFCEVVLQALMLRSSKATERNSNSSRSHAILTIFVDGCKLSLVDLAGSERNYETQTMTASQHRDSAYINKSLFYLKECFRAYSAQSKASSCTNEDSSVKYSSSHIFSSTPQSARIACKENLPYNWREANQLKGVEVIRQNSGLVKAPFRECLLTRVLKECFSLENSHKTSIICTVSPSPIDVEHTLNSLEHVVMMDTNLQDNSWVNTLEIPINGALVSDLPVEMWTHSEVYAWLGTVDNGRFSQLVLPPDIDGLKLLSLDSSSLATIFSGEMREARQEDEGSAWIETVKQSSKLAAISAALCETIRRERYSSFRRYQEAKANS